MNAGATSLLRTGLTTRTTWTERGPATLNRIGEECLPIETMDGTDLTHLPTVPLREMDEIQRHCRTIGLPQGHFPRTLLWATIMVPHRPILVTAASEGTGWAIPPPSPSLVLLNRQYMPEAAPCRYTTINRNMAPKCRTRIPIPRTRRGITPSLEATLLPGARIPPSLRPNNSNEGKGPALETAGSEIAVRNVRHLRSVEEATAAATAAAIGTTPTSAAVADVAF
jgi:hypothetical protein